MHKMDDSVHSIDWPAADINHYSHTHTLTGKPHKSIVFRQHGFLKILKYLLISSERDIRNFHNSFITILIERLWIYCYKCSKAFDALEVELVLFYLNSRT